MPNPKDPQKLKEYRQKMSKLAKAKGFGKWMNGRTLSSETKKKLSVAQKARCTPEECVRRSIAAKANGTGLWMAGKKRNPKSSEKAAQHRRGKMYEEIYGPRAAEEKLKRKKGNRRHWENIPRKSDERPHQGDTWEYTEWRNAVFERDGYTCKKCNTQGGILNAHHIFPWALFPLFRFLIWNGITLCEECHKGVHWK